MPLAAHNLSFAYTPDKPILRDVSVAFEPGAITAVLGPNGAGKTTLLRLLLGLRTPTAGRVTFQNRDFSGLSRAERAARLAYIPQTSTLAFPFSVRQVVRMGRYASPGGPEPAHHRMVIDAALQRLELADLADEPFGILSAGQQQRVAVARALAQLSVPSTSPSPRGEVDAHSAPQSLPRALLADEPVSAMDPRQALASLAVLRELAAAGLAVIIVLHDLPTIFHHADHAVLLSARGQVAAAGPVRQTLTPQTLHDVFGVPFEYLHSSSGRAALLPADPSTLASPAGNPAR